MNTMKRALATLAALVMLSGAGTIAGAILAPSASACTENCTDPVCNSLCDDIEKGVVIVYHLTRLFG